MLCRSNISNGTRGLYELKRHTPGDCHLRVDEQFRGKNCPRKVRGRDGRVLYEVKLAAEREVYMELDVPYVDHRRLFY